MVRGNWQKRVEMADARRKEGKQKKLRDQDRRLYKTWMQDLLVQMDHDYSLLDDCKKEEEKGNKKQRIPLTSSTTTTLHVWSETMPMPMPAWHDLNRQAAAKLDMTTTASNSNTQSSSSGRKSKKKLHPRSKELEQNKNHHSEASSSATAVTNTTGDKKCLLLCKRYFFSGKCSIAGCRRAHYNNQDDDDDNVSLTMAAVLLKRANEKSSQSQQQLDDACHAAGGGSVPKTATTTTLDKISSSSPQTAVADAMDMVYYIPIDLKSSSTTTSTSTTTSLSVSDLITTALVERSIPLSSIVYIVLQDRLLYDRYRNGIIILHHPSSNSNTMQPFVGGGGASKISDHIRENQHLDHDGGDDIADDDTTTHHHLPNAILEHILTYLPDDSAVTVLSRVCKAWHCEISSNSASPNLWIHLLQRQGWPVVPVILPNNNENDNGKNGDNTDELNAITTTTASAATTTTTTTLSSSAIYRQQYIKHYLAMRNIRALALGVSALLRPRYYDIPGDSIDRHPHLATSIPETEMTFSDFTNNGRKQFTSKNLKDRCVAMLEWSPQHMLAAYARDCSLRLFQAVRSNDATAIMMASGRLEHRELQQNRRRGGGGLPKKRCKELICFNVDPYRSTKKRTCTLESVAIDAEYIGCLCSVSAENVLPSSDTNAAIIVFTSRDDFLLDESSSSSAATVHGGGGANADILEDSKVIDIGEAVLNFLLSSNAVNTDHRYMPLMNFLSNGGEIGDVSIKASWHLIACGHGRFLVEVTIAIPLQEGNFDQDAIHQLDRKVVLFSANAGSMVLWMGESYPMHTGSLPPAHNSAVVMAGCSLLPRHQTGQLLSPSRPLLTVAIRSELEPSILVYEMDCFNIRTRHQQEDLHPRFVEESCLARNEILAQLAAASAISGEDGDEARQQVEWRVHPSHHLLATSTDIVVVDLLQCHIIQAERQNVNDVDPNRTTSQIRDRKTILSFYPHSSPRASSSSSGSPDLQRSSYDLLTLTGMLQAKDMMNDERNDHIIVLCTELQKKERRGRGLFPWNPDRGRQQAQQDVAVEENGHASDDEEGEDAGGLDGEWFGANQDGSHCWEESLVLVAVHVPSRREIGRKTLSETKVVLTMNQVHDYDLISSPSSWRPRLSSVSAGGTLGLALNVVGIILTGDDVRSLGATDQILLTGTGGENAEHGQNSGKKKNKKGKKSSGGKKDGFARGQNPW